MLTESTTSHDDDDEEEKDLLPSLTSDDTLVIYCHGNAETRSQHHRRELYKVKTQDYK